MKLEQTSCCDVLVLGSGIAGLSAALSAAGAGASVTLVCKGPLFSGSSFYPGTWGLGLIGPADRDDEQDLMDTIRTVGCGMADPALVRALVSGIHPAIEAVRRMGVKLRTAAQGAEKEYIPCFDHKHRDWNGLEFDSLRQVFTAELDRLQVSVLSGWEAIELVKTDDRVCGAMISSGTELAYLGCKALVLATGGYGSLFRHHLCTSDVEGLGQALALNAGCRLINMEFMQIMPGYLRPAYQTIFNEKAFRFTDLRTGQGEDILGENQDELLAVRSGHGPFTSRLISKEVDLAIEQVCARDPDGVTVTYSDEMKRRPPEFVKTYFDWLETARHLTPDDPVHIGLFAHAANGGIRISPDAFTGVPGLFAAGEVTGGMHGADRIGGLSTANGLVFGGKAGLSAAGAARQWQQTAPESWKIESVGAENTDLVFRSLQEIMTRFQMVSRSGQGLSEALTLTERLRTQLETVPSDDVRRITDLRRIQGQLLTAESILTASRMRKESRGSHYRCDCPQTDPAFQKNIVLEQKDGKLYAQFV